MEMSGGWPRNILLVTDGSPDGEAAIIAAAILAERTSAAVEAVVILPTRIPIPPSSDRSDVAEHWEPSERREAAHLIRAARRQYRETLPDRDRRGNWSRCVAIGDPGATIVRLVEQRPVDLVVTGLGQQELLDEGAGGRTAVCAARYLTVPLYAVAPGHAAAKAALIVCPDGEIRAETVGAALACLSPNASATLVLPGGSGDDHSAQPTLARVHVAGDMLAGVLRLAEEMKVDVIAVPLRGDAGPMRAFLPNIAEPLLGAARCSVLVVPR